MNIVYLHGLSSSGQTKTAHTLRNLFPNDNVITPDIPVNPVDALQCLKDLVTSLPKEDTIIIGTSMGAMYAQQLIGFHRILVNPAFHVSEILRENEGKTLPFFSKRQDGATEFAVTPELCRSFEHMEEHQFDHTDSTEYVTAFFGDEDTTVNCKDEYLVHYTNYHMFHGAHRMNVEVLKTIIRPAICRLKLKLAKAKPPKVNLFELVGKHREDFTRLYNAYKDLQGLQCVQRCNRVFYSDTEREYYDRNLCENLQRNYEDLFDIHITARHPELRYLKKIINHPYLLAHILDEPW